MALTDPIEIQGDGSVIVRPDMAGTWLDPTIALADRLEMFAHEHGGDKPDHRDMAAMLLLEAVDRIRSHAASHASAVKRYVAAQKVAERIAHDLVNTNATLMEEIKRLKKLLAEAREPKRTDA